MVEQAALFPFAPTRGEALFFNLHASNGSGCHGGCFLPPPFPHHAAAAPASAVAELGVVRRCYAHSMKTIFWAALAIVALASHARANTVIMVEIKTTQASVAYSINNQPFTPTELAVWMKNCIKSGGHEEPILIRPDSQTTFATVFTLLESLKASGVKHFEVITELSNTPTGYTKRFLTTNAQDLKLTKISAMKPPK